MRFIKRAALFCLPLCILIFVASAASGDELLLRWKFKEGDVFNYKLGQNMVQDTMGMKIVKEQFQYMDWKVLAVEEDVATFEITVKRITGKAGSAMGEMTYDSAKNQGEPTPGFDVESMMVGHQYKLKMNTRGHVVEVIGFSGIKDKVMKRVDEMVAQDPRMAQAKGMIASIMTDEYQTMVLNQEIPLLPEGPMDVGTEWKEDSGMSFPPPMPKIVSKKQNTLESVEGGVAKIKFTGIVEKAKDQKIAEDDPMAAMTNMIQVTEGRLEGTLEFDRANGLIRKCNTKTSITMEMMGQKAPMTQERTLELLEPAKEVEKPVKAEE